MLRAGCRVLPQSMRAQAAAAAAAGRGAGRPIYVVPQHLRSDSLITGQREMQTRWRYAADEVVTEMVAREYCNISCLMLNTARPVSPQVFETALLHLFMKADSLKVCLPQRDGRLWVADMDAPKIDFQVLEGGNLYDVLRETESKAYNLAEGPLWRARLLPCLPDEACSLPQVKAAFPHQYHFIFDANHAINDGNSLISLMDIFLKIMDGLLDGAQIDYEPVDGKLRDGRQIRAIEDKIRANLLKDPQRLKVLLEERSKVLAKVPLITEAFGDPREPSPRTHILKGEMLEEKLLQAFNDKCMAHKVTLNSGMTALINTALVEMVRDAGVLRDSYTVCSLHPIDTRRYFDRKSLQTMIYGHHGVNMTHSMDTPWDVKRCLWKYATELDAKFRGNLSNFGCLEERVVGKLLQQETPTCKSKVSCDYFFSNVYSPRLRTFGGGKHVRLSEWISYVNMMKNTYGGCFILSKLGNLARLQFVYSSGYMTKEIAAEFTKRVVDVFNDTAKAAE